MKSIPPCHAALSVPPGWIVPVGVEVAVLLLLLELPQPAAPRSTTPSANAQVASHIPGRLIASSPFGVSRCPARPPASGPTSPSRSDDGEAAQVSGRERKPL